MTIYRERANGRWEFWAYSDAASRIYLSAAFVARERERGACIIDVR